MSQATAYVVTPRAVAVALDGVVHFLTVPEAEALLAKLILSVDAARQDRQVPSP